MRQKAVCAKQSWSNKVAYRATSTGKSMHGMGEVTGNTAANPREIIYAANRGKNVIVSVYMPSAGSRSSRDEAKILPQTHI